MICPKCKTKVSKDDTTCPNCNLKLIFKCPRCSSPTRLGSMRCKKCAYTFVKTCPQCQNMNFATSSVCRKCGYDFNKIEENKIAQQPVEQTETKEILTEKIPPRKIALTLEKEQEVKIQTEQTEEKPLLFYIDFLNLDNTFEQYNKEEFKQTIIQGIKNTVKIVFNVNCDFVDSHTVMFKYNYTKKTKILDKFEQFEKELEKFNQLLEKSLGTCLSYKFAICTDDEVRKNGEVNQLKFGSSKDVIISSDTYSKLSNELSLIKISADSYKLIFLEQKPSFEQSKDVKYEKALKIILENLSDNNSQTRVISVNAPRGVGKTRILDDLYYRVSKTEYNTTTVLYSQCSALTQISSYGLIQSIFINLFDCKQILKSNFDIKSFEKNVTRILEIEKIDEENLETLANIIYPTKKDYFEHILINKEITYKYLKDIFNFLKQKRNIVFIIDDFDLIDEASYGFIKYLVDSDFFKQNAKLILGYKNQHSAIMYLQSDKLASENCLNISLRPWTTPECKSFIKKALGIGAVVPEEILSEIAYNAQGNVAYIEQVLQYLYERKILQVEDKIVKFNNAYENMQIPALLEDCFEERLNFLKDNYINEYMFLMVASLLGDKIDYATLSTVFELEEESFFDVIAKLEKSGYLKRRTGDLYGFKNSLTWSYCYIRAKEEEIIKPTAKKLLVELNSKTVSSPLICPILAQIIDNKELAYSLWTKNLQHASYIGDVNIYTMAQKQSLILLESVKVNNFEYTRTNICERLGKLNYIKHPQEAKEYLSNAIIAAQKNDDVNKIIDLSGYITKSAYLTQDYTGVVEIIDNVLKYFDSKDKSQKKSITELQIALIKTRKINALLKMGSWEEIVNIVNTEINPVLQKNLNMFTNHKWVSQSEIFYAWVECNILLAQSYAQQGSPLASELIPEIKKVIKDSKNDKLKLRLAFAEAMLATSIGGFNSSNIMLEEILKNYSYMMDSEFFNEWNIINIINKILLMETKDIKKELFEATAYANNTNDELSKHILKTLLAYIFLEERTFVKAIEIATNEMQYFSSKKIAFGALLAWYISAAATAANQASSYCIEICEKAVKICENAQNNNIYFKILFQELLSRTYLKTNDKENASLYCDLAYQGADANELYYLKIRLEELKAIIAKEYLSAQPDKKKADFAQNIIKIYNRAITMAQRLSMKKYTKTLEKELTSFKAHCQLNRIIEDKKQL